ncbi:hypothetical protein B0J18DRAFT_467985 [Chaetomium sp. MPI-SDFR-AT-0129]|nr:hypothetical protein B0J18DRAFT_467985 [Chaetomium sp. MPI-SDFR-AT-0129]
MPPPVPVSANRGDAQRPREPSTLYKFIMTPLIFTTFLLSLALVDLRHSISRTRYHAHPTSTAADDAAHSDHRSRTRLPPWLHRLIYRYQPYRYDRERPGSSATASPAVTPGLSPGTPGTPGSYLSKGEEAGDYYHSKQRKLMKMEAEEAFEMRGMVVVVLGVVSVGVMWAAWRAVSWGLGVLWGLLAI